MKIVETMVPRDGRGPPTNSDEYYFAIRDLFPHVPPENPHASLRTDSRAPAPPEAIVSSTAAIVVLLQSMVSPRLPIAGCYSRWFSSWPAENRSWALLYNTKGNCGIIPRSQGARPAEMSVKSASRRTPAHPVTRHYLFA